LKVSSLLLLLLVSLSSLPAVCAQEQQNMTRLQLFRQRMQQRKQSQSGANQSADPSAANRADSDDSEATQPANRPSAAAVSAALVAQDVAYGPEQRQKLDIYAPPKQNILAPVVLFVHGGGWKRGNKSQHSAKGVAFANHGVVFVCTNYRLAPNVVHPKQIQDIASAFAWVNTNIKKYGGDPYKMFVMGHSAGAHLVDLLATNDKYLAEKGLSFSDVKGVVSLDTASLNLVERGSQPGLASKMVGEMVETAFGHDRNTLIDASPMLNIQKGKKYPPFLMFYSAQRADSRAAHKEFEQTLLDSGGTITLRSEPLNHAEISQGAGNEQSDIFVQSLQFIQGK
jgi:arylformamidase